MYPLTLASTFRTFLILFLFLIPFGLMATNTTESKPKGYELTLDLTNYDSNRQVFVGYYYGVRYNFLDTLAWQPGQRLTFAADSLLPEGAYLFFLEKGQKTINFVLTEKEQRLCLEADAQNLSARAIRVKQSKENKRFYDYLRFVGSKRPELNRIRNAMQDTSGTARTVLQLELEKVYDDIGTYQRKFIQKHPGTITAFLMSLDLGPKMPAFAGTPEEVLQQKAVYQRRHFFEEVDVADPRLLRTTIFMRKVNSFVQEITPQHPDSVSQAVDQVLAMLENQEATYQYVANFLLRSFDRPRVIGMDAVYVHLVEQYVSLGKLPWKTEEEIQKMEKEARRRKPILIGQVAPNVKLEQQDGSSISLHEVKAAYTVLYIWRPNCGYCKKATPHVKAFYEKYKDQGVAVVGACSLTGDKTKQCWDYVKDQELPYLNLADSTHRSRFIHRFNAQRTPKFFILGKDKTILVKDFKGAQLETVFKRLRQRQDNWF